MSQAPVGGERREQTEDEKNAEQVRLAHAKEGAPVGNVSNFQKVREQFGHVGSQLKNAAGAEIERARAHAIHNLRKRAGRLTPDEKKQELQKLKQERDELRIKSEIERLRHEKNFRERGHMSEADQRYLNVSDAIPKFYYGNTGEISAQSWDSFYGLSGQQKAAHDGNLMKLGDAQGLYGGMGLERESNFDGNIMRVNDNKGLYGGFSTFDQKDIDSVLGLGKKTKGRRR